MSISDADVNRERQEKKIADRHEKEAATRPDAVHRALLFILKEIAQNNPDAKNEAEFFVSELDQQLADPDSIDAAESESIETTSPATPDPAAPTSRRFRRRN